MISVVIPALNEEEKIGECIAALRTGGPACEIIVADGGSKDRTIGIAADLPGVRIVHSARGRGTQMNAGVAAAEGDVLLFLHADTILEPGWAGDMAQCLTDGKTVGGAFRFAINSPGWAYRLVEAWVALRCRIFRLPYGDQAIFVRKEVFTALGGYRDIPLMEDVDLVARMKQIGRITILPTKALTSDRRWASKGIIPTALMNQVIMLLYLLGMSPHRLARLYYR